MKFDPSILIGFAGGLVCVGFLAIFVVDDKTGELIGKMMAPIATLIVGLAAVFIANRQAEIASSQAETAKSQAETAQDQKAISQKQAHTAAEKLRLDLFDKRFVIYEGLLSLVKSLQTHEIITRKHREQMFDLQARALLLVPGDESGQMFQKAFKMVKEAETATRNDQGKFPHEFQDRAVDALKDCVIATGKDSIFNPLKS